MSSPHLLLRSRHTVVDGAVLDAVVWAVEGTIVAVIPPDDPAARGAEDLGEAWLIPGLVDSHVHVNEPGRTDWEGFATATRAAASGGITTIVDMPLNSVPATTSAAALTAKVAAAEGQCQVDVAFWGGVVPGNASELKALARAGVAGFKAFLSPSGVEEFQNVNLADLAAAAPALAAIGLPLLVHAEEPSILADAASVWEGADPRRYATWLASRPSSAETLALAGLVTYARTHRIHVHVVHLASGDLWPVVRDARARGWPLSAETCPHYLTFAAEELPDGATEFKCAPPIREAAHREALWQGLRAGAIEMVASDHSPSPPALKHRESGDFRAAWGGVASLELSLPAVWTGARTRGFEMIDVVRWMSATPARLAGLGERKGRLVPGYDADFVVFEPDNEFVVEGTRLHQRHPLTPYEGQRLSGRVRRTYVSGHLVFEDGRFDEPRGEPLLRLASGGALG
ncbi:MAG: allantoinase AllB [Candidatus Eisenbacteria bacterium]|uniref:allantoinase n=1 Tax=Eiseniibacteriota bacterium TaxID=2212470 RepID=A0A849SQ99_UNCEI|nr:allantoinase AllB [Candidatus Eisenbacteria bacterium]